jgi:hypothetical protein
MKKFSHMFDIAFTIENEIEDPDRIPVSDLITALELRIGSLRATPPDASRYAFGWNDSYEIDDEKLDPSTGNPGLPQA